MTDKNYYEILGLGQHADGAAVHRSYWHLARTYQALAPSDPRARQMLDDLNEAYGVLGTPPLREEYDATYVAPGEDASHGRQGAAKRSGRGISLSGLLSWRHKGASLPSGAEPRVEMAPVAEATPTAPRRVRPTSVDDLRLSTASIVGRLRQSATPPDVLRAQAPDTTLVDIFQSERELEEPAEPLSAVLDVLRGSREPANSH